MNQLAHFQKRHFQTYQQWFVEDAELNRFLGPMDEEWLEHVLHEQHGYQYVWEAQGQLLAVAGIHLPNAEHPYYVLTDISVNPLLRRSGTGSMMLRFILTAHPPEGNIYWVTYVDCDNKVTQEFFSKQSWSVEEALSSADLIAYRYPTAST